LDNSRGCVEWRGRFAGHSGLALEARSFIKSLQAEGFHAHRVSVEPGRRPRPVPGAFPPCPRDPDITVLHVLWHDDGWSNLPENPRIWRAVFETAAIPSSWLARAREVDEIWVPSLFNAAAVTAGGIPAAKVRVLPQAIDDTGLKTRSRPYSGGGTFRFLSVFTWQYRKGWDVLLESYCLEFTAADDVELIIRADPFAPEGCDIPASIAAVQARFANPPHIRLLRKTLSAAALRRLYADAHAFVLPTRGEAWGRPFMEAMACGLLTIGTGWGGQLDFMDAGNSLLVDFELAEVPEAAAREWPEFRGQQWAEPSVDALRRCLRRAVDNGADLTALRTNGQAVIRERYRQDRISKLLAAEIRRHVS